MADELDALNGSSGYSGMNAYDPSFFQREEKPEFHEAIFSTPPSSTWDFSRAVSYETSHPENEEQITMNFQNILAMSRPRNGDVGININITLENDPKVEIDAHAGISDNYGNKASVKIQKSPSQPTNINIDLQHELQFKDTQQNKDNNKQNKKPK